MYTISCKIDKDWKWKPIIKLYGRTLNTLYYTANYRGMSCEQYVKEYAHKEMIINGWYGVRVTREGKRIYEEVTEEA